MANTPKTKPARDNKRAELIKKELLEARKIAGIEPPRLIARGDKFRSASTSRPVGAVSQELGLPMVRGEINNDFVATAIETKYVAKPMIALLKEYRKLALKRAEAALEMLSANQTPRLFESIAEQINLATMADPNDTDVRRLQAKFNEIRYAGINFDDEKGTPGGGVKLD